MGHLFNKNSFAGKLSLIAISIISIVLLFSFLSLLFNIAIYVLPVVVIAWLGYKGVSSIKNVFKSYNRKNIHTYNVEVVDKEGSFNSEEEESKIIDVDYTDA